MSLKLLPEWCMLEEEIHREQHPPWVIYCYTNSIFHLYPASGAFYWGKVPQVQPERTGKGKSPGPFLHFEKTLSDLCQSEPSLGGWGGTLGKTAVSRTCCHFAGLYENHTYYTIFRVLSQGRWRQRHVSDPLFFFFFFRRENRIYWIFKNIIYLAWVGHLSADLLKIHQAFPCKRGGDWSCSFHVKMFVSLWALEILDSSIA